MAGPLPISQFLLYPETVTKKLWPWPRKHLFIHALNNPKRVQEHALRQIVSQISKTNYGLLFNLKSSDTYEQFSKKIPIVIYEQLKTWIERQRTHDTNLLVDERITRYAFFQYAKLIPYTQTLETSFARQEAIQGKASEYLEAPLWIELPISSHLIPFISDVFFEFRNSEQKILRLHEVMPGESYDLIISQQSGLYRYDIGLRVLACEFQRKTPTFQIVHDAHLKARQALKNSDEIIS